MQDIPKIARQRLQATANPGPHPDSDVLTAFLERALTQRERQPVLEHLAQCANCREVVSWSATPPEAGPERAVSRGWFSWPVLRWAAAAACVVVVGAAVTLRFQDKRTVATFTKERDVPAAAAEEKSETALQLNQGPADKLSATNEVARRQPAPARRAIASELAKKADVGQLSKVVAPSSPKSSDAPASAPAQIVTSAPAPLASGGGVGSGATVVVTDEARVSVAAAEPAPGKAKEALQKPAANAKVRMEMGAVNGLADSDRELQGSFSKSNVAVTPRWTLSSDATLQRSLDGGRSWENISVASKTKFRALAAFGLEIWVGGSAGGLYHSVDAGGHWVQVKPEAGGGALTADIIGVEFTDPQHGKLTTAGNETWVTVDGGQSWTKQ